MGARLSDIADVRHGGAEEVSLPRPQVDLLEGVARGEPSASATLYDALCPLVVRTLKRILRDPGADYDDLVQTTFERIVRTLVEKGASSVSNVPAWGAAIAAHVALDALRVKIRERKLFLHDATHEASSSEVGPSLERQLEARRKLLWVQEALARMNADQARTLVLHDVLGHDLVETASLTGVTVAAAQKRLWRARQDLLNRSERRREKP